MVTNHTLGTSILQIQNLVFAMLLSTVLPFAALHRAVSASPSFIRLLFIYWKLFHACIQEID